MAGVASLREGLPHLPLRPTPSGCALRCRLPRPPPALQDYYYYLASNWRSAGNVHIDMANYKKIYDVKAEYQLPERIFLDKGTSYSFSIFLTARGHSFKSELEPGLWAGPRAESERWGRAGWDLDTFPGWAWF